MKDIFEKDIRTRVVELEYSVCELQEAVRKLEISRGAKRIIAYTRQGVKVDRSYAGVNVDICENGATYIVDSKTDEVLEMLPTTFPEQEVRR